MRLQNELIIRHSSVFSMLLPYMNWHVIGVLVEKLIEYCSCSFAIFGRNYKAFHFVAV